MGGRLIWWLWVFKALLCVYVHVYVCVLYFYVDPALQTNKERWLKTFTRSGVVMSLSWGWGRGECRADRVWGGRCVLQASGEGACPMAAAPGFGSWGPTPTQSSHV